MHQESEKQRYTDGIAMLYCQYRYAALSVPGCCTIGTRVLHFSGTIIRVSLHWLNQEESCVPPRSLLHGFVFWFIFWFWLYLGRTREILDGFCKWRHLLSLGQYIYVKLQYANMTILISAAASGHACKSVYNPFASKNKGQKKSV